MEKPSLPTVDANGNVVLDCHFCYACDAMHNALPLHAYKRSVPPWSHWYTCPTLGEPVSLTIVTDGKGNVEIANSVLRSLADATRCGRYMVAIWYLDGGKIMMTRTTCEYPQGEFAASVRLLDSDLAKEAGPALPTIMQPAGERRPTINLFGKQ